MKIPERAYTVVLFDERPPEGSSLPLCVPPESGFSVVRAAHMLDVIHLLKTEDVGVVIAHDGLSKEEREDFLTVVEMLRPRTRVFFMGIVRENCGGVTLDGENFARFLQGTLSAETALSDRIGDFKDFFFSFAERMLQIFGAIQGGLYGKDHLVARLSERTARRMGLPEELVENVRIAALLRDIGMLSIKQQLLEERRRLNSRELLSVKKHPVNTVQILRQVKFPWNVDSIILQHHEHYGGKGYPAGLRGREITVGARIVHVADAYVAMTTKRPYRRALADEDAQKEIVKGAGAEFDPEVVEAFLGVLEEERAARMRRRKVVVLERAPSVLNLLRLAADAGRFEVVAVTTLARLLHMARSAPPDVVVADMDVFSEEGIALFSNAFHGIPALSECRFVFVQPEGGGAKPFAGDNVSYLSLPLDMGDLAAVLRRVDSPEAAEEPEADTQHERRGMSGELEDFPLADIVQVLRLGIKTARIEIASNGNSGVIAMEGGNLVSAETGHNSGQNSGESAFMQMMRWEKGTFSIFYGRTDIKRNITSETMFLLLEATRTLDEQRRG